MILPGSKALKVLEVVENESEKNISESTKQYFSGV